MTGLPAPLATWMRNMLTSSSTPPPPDPTARQIGNMPPALHIGPPHTTITPASTDPGSPDLHAATTPRNLGPPVGPVEMQVARLRHIVHALEQLHVTMEQLCDQLDHAIERQRQEPEQ